MLRFPSASLQSASPSVAIILEKVGTLDSGWVWGDEVLAQGLAAHLTKYAVQILSAEDAAARASAGESFDFAFHLRENFPLLGRRNVFWLQNGQESFHGHLTYPQWVNDCVALGARRFDAVATPSLKWRRLVAELGGRAFHFPQFADTDRFAPSTDDAHEVRGCIVYVSNNIKGEESNSEYLYPLVEAFGPERFALYGAGWETSERFDLLESCWRGPLHPSDLPRVYSRAGLVLSIHLASHRREGVVTSRIYEALACGALVATDAVRDCGRWLGDLCLVGQGGSDLVRKCAEGLTWDEGRRRRHADRVRNMIVRNHSAARRAQRLSAVFSSL